MSSKNLSRNLSTEGPDGSPFHGSLLELFFERRKVERNLFVRQQTCRPKRNEGPTVLLEIFMAMKL